MLTYLPGPGNVAEIPLTKKRGLYTKVTRNIRTVLYNVSCKRLIYPDQAPDDALSLP